MVALAFIFVIFIVGFLVIITASLITYIISKIIFDRRTNAALSGGNVKQKKMLRPIAITGIVAGALFIVFIGTAAIVFGLSAAYGTVYESETSVIVDEEMPSADLYFQVEGSTVEPDGDVYELISTHSDNDITIEIYGIKDNYPYASKYFIVSTYTGDKEVAAGEAMFSGDFRATGTMIDLEDPSYAVYTPLWGAEYPGTLRISFRDKSGAEITLTNIELE